MSDQKDFFFKHNFKLKLSTRIEGKRIALRRGGGVEEGKLETVEGY